MSQPPDWLDQITALPGPPFLRMGTRALGGGWLVGGDDVGAQLAEKRRLLGRHHAEVFAALPGTEAPGAELLAEVCEHAAPGGQPVDDGARPGRAHPLEDAARLVAEDLCLLVPAAGGRGWILGAGSVCFPSHWQLGDKLGQPVAAIHAPVPHFPDELAERVDRFLDRLGTGQGVWRRNWTVHPNDRLFAPTPQPPPEPPITGQDAGRRLWFRSEYQTLRRLRRAEAIVFSIRTQQVPLDALAGRPDVCRALADAAASWSPELLAYRGGEELRRPFVAWLRQVGGSTAG